VASRINRAIELLAQDQAIYYVGAHSGHVLTRAQGREDAGTWADYINIGMEHGAFDMAGLEEYLRGMVEAGPTRSGHRTPTIIVEAPVNGTDIANVRYNAWQFRQILGRGAHGVLLCQAETPGAVRAFVESCRYPHHLEAVDPFMPTPLERMRGEGSAHRNGADAGEAKPLGLGTRGRGSESSAAPIWDHEQPVARACWTKWSSSFSPTSANSCWRRAASASKSSGSRLGVRARVWLISSSSVMRQLSLDAGSSSRIG